MDDPRVEKKLLARQEANKLAAARIVVDVHTANLGASLPKGLDAEALDVYMELAETARDRDKTTSALCHRFMNYPLVQTQIKVCQRRLAKKPDYDANNEAANVTEIIEELRAA